MRIGHPILVVVLGLLTGCGEDQADPPRPPQSPLPRPPAVADPSPLSAEPPAPSPTPIAPLPPSRIEARGPYPAEVGQLCDGLPALPLETAEGLCVGIVVHTETSAIDAARGRFRPRGIVADPTRADVMWVIDHGARRPRAGRVWRLERGESGWTPRSVFQHLDRPHGGRVGPDGWIYVGEVQRIFRFDPRADDPASTREVVVDGMPTVGFGERPIRFHPLTSFVFTPEGDLIVNMGSYTDRCLESVEESRCHDEADRTAALWRYRRSENGSWSTPPEVYARGLRNSVALAVHPSGTLVQGENGVDFRDPQSPMEELNVIEESKHYGWPYCFDRAGVDPAWSGADFDCDPADNPLYAPPQLLLPPHGAPLGMAYYEGSLEPLAGRLLIAFHGYRATGHRVLSYPVDARGIPAPAAEPQTVIAGWDATDNSPRGSPVELAVALDGSLWLTEDTNGTVLRLARDAYAGRRGEEVASESATIEVEPEFVVLQREVLIPRCGACHEFVRGEPTFARRAVAREGWLRPSGSGTTVAERLTSPERPMPPGGPLPPAERAQFDAWLSAAIP